MSCQLSTYLTIGIPVVKIQNDEIATNTSTSTPAVNLTSCLISLNSTCWLVTDIFMFNLDVFPLPIELEV